MSNEASVRIALTIQKSNLNYQSRPSAFNADMNGEVGPTPGSFIVTPEGTDVDFSQLTSLGGLCWIQNVDDTNNVTYGIWYPAGGLFFPFGKLLPGECYLLRLDDLLGDQEPAGVGPGTGTGTGTSGSGNRLRFKAHVADCVVRVDAFDP